MKKIRYLEAGDELLSCYLGKKRRTLSNAKVKKIEMINGNDIISILTAKGKYDVGPQQLFYDPVSQGWVEAADLVIGDFLINSSLMTVEINRISMARPSKLNNRIQYYLITTEKYKPFFINGGKKESVLVKK